MRKSETEPAGPFLVVCPVTVLSFSFSFHVPSSYQWPAVVAAFASAVQLAVQPGQTDQTQCPPQQLCSRVAAEKTIEKD